jgi:hypothetical protein
MEDDWAEDSDVEGVPERGRPRPRPDGLREPSGATRGVGLAVVPASNARDFNFISGTNAKLDDPAGGSSEIYRSSATALRY